MESKSIIFFSTSALLPLSDLSMVIVVRCHIIWLFRAWQAWNECDDKYCFLGSAVLVLAVVAGCCIIQADVMGTSSKSNSAWIEVFIVNGILVKVALHFVWINEVRGVWQLLLFFFLIKYCTGGMPNNKGNNTGRTHHAKMSSSPILKSHTSSRCL